MGTEKLYYEDAKLWTFTAVVRDCREAKDGWDIVLDRTAFYPEGGGQPSDRGTLNGLDVLDVQECGGEILHRKRCADMWTARTGLTICSSIPRIIF